MGGRKIRREVRGLCAQLSSLQFPPLPSVQFSEGDPPVTISLSQGSLSSPGIDGDNLGVSESENQAGQSNGCWVSPSLPRGPRAGPHLVMASLGPTRPLSSAGCSPGDHRKPGGSKSPAKTPWPAFSTLNRWLQLVASVPERIRGRTSAVLATAPNGCCP